MSVVENYLASAEDAHLTLERPIEFKTLDDCKEAVEVLELMYRRFHTRPLAICETQTGVDIDHLPSTPIPEDREYETPTQPGSRSSPPIIEGEQSA